MRDPRDQEQRRQKDDPWDDGGTHSPAVSGSYHPEKQPGRDTDSPETGQPTGTQATRTGSERDDITRLQEADTEQHTQRTDNESTRDSTAGVTIPMSRRQVLASGGAGALALGTGGWWTFLRGPTGPEKAAIEHFEILNDSDFAELKSSVHPDGPAMRTLETDTTGDSPVKEQFIEFTQSREFEVTTVERYDEQTDPEAGAVSRVVSVFVAVTVTRSRDTGANDGQETPEAHTWPRILKFAPDKNGRWRLWEMGILPPGMPR